MKKVIALILIGAMMVLMSCHQTKGLNSNKGLKNYQEYKKELKKGKKG